MAYEQKPNSGILARNEKATDEKHAEYTGTALIDGVEYYVDAWVNEFKSGPRQGKKYFSLRFKPKQQQTQQRSSSRQAPQQDDEDVPF